MDPEKCCNRRFVTGIVFHDGIILPVNFFDVSFPFAGSPGLFSARPALISSH
jgi:hypothetical protein